MPHLVRVAARVLTGSTYAVLGFQAVCAPGARVDLASTTIASLRKLLPLPEDDGLIVRGNAAAQVLAGTLLTIGKLPRLSALGLTCSLIPTTLAGHAFWTIEDDKARSLQRVQFHKNLAMIGGVLYAAVDNPQESSAFDN